MSAADGDPGDGVKSGSPIFSCFSVVCLNTECTFCFCCCFLSMVALNNESEKRSGDFRGSFGESHGGVLGSHIGVFWGVLVRAEGSLEEF